ncbi:HNH endonuclease [Patescibacteria group bacterium]|nr:HNH endonuclease [Patescibacteria group bacterium]MBU1124304.1 HNH endonuclease [Patescibacteria group bacterium]
MDFKLRTNAIYADDKELIADLQRVAGLLNKQKVTQKEYNKNGRYHFATYIRRFGGWNKALQKAGLEVGLKRTITNQELFDNLEVIWRTLDRQPFVGEMKKPLSKFNHATYQRRFGSWIKACEEFIKYKKGDVEFIKMAQSESTARSRNINNKKRLKILKRDNYKCIICGRSPATHAGIFLHIDHIQPFSKGGSNEIDNLRTLCHKCNLGKNNDENL